MIAYFGEDPIMETRKIIIPVLSANRIVVSHAAGDIAVQETDMEKKVVLSLQHEKPLPFPIDAIEIRETLRLTSRTPSYYEWSHDDTLDMDIFVPRGFSVTIAHKQGNVFVHTTGKHDLAVKKGAITSKGVRGYGRFHTQIGDITIQQMLETQQLQASVRIGNIQVEIPRGVEIAIMAKTDVGRIQSNRKSSHDMMNHVEPGDEFTYNPLNAQGRAMLETKKGDINVWFA
jgi:hypothetical protein